MNDLGGPEDYGLPEYEPAEADQPAEDSGLGESGPMREPEPSGDSAGRVPGQVALGEEPYEGAAPSWADDLAEARRLISRATNLLDRIASGMARDGMVETAPNGSHRSTDRENVMAALAMKGQATNAEIAELTGLPKTRVNIALHYMNLRDERVQVVRRGVYRWRGEALSVKAEEHPPVEAPAPPPPAPSARMLAKQAREAEAARIAATMPLQIAAPSVPAYFRPHIGGDDTEHAEKLTRGEVITGGPKPAPTSAPDDVEFVEWNPAWGPKPGKGGA